MIKRHANVASIILEVSMALSASLYRTLTTSGVHNTRTLSMNQCLNFKAKRQQPFEQILNRFENVYWLLLLLLFNCRTYQNHPSPL